MSCMCGLCSLHSDVPAAAVREATLSFSSVLCSPPADRDTSDGSQGLKSKAHKVFVHLCSDAGILLLIKANELSANKMFIVT